MPQQSDAQILGDAGELWFETQLPPGWIPQRPRRDVGVDFLVVICEAGPLNGHEFRVQVKTSKQFKVVSDAVMITGVKRTTIDYWFISPVPTMVVAYDHGQRRGYYRWHSDLIHEISRLQSDTRTRTVSLSIPIQNALVSSAWNDIRRGLLWHHSNLRAALYDARDAKSVLPLIHGLAAAVRHLNSIEHQPIPEAQRTPQQEGLLALFEMIQHRDVIKAASRLMSELVPGSEGAERLSSWINEYRTGVTSVYPTFDQLPEGDWIPPDFQVAYARNLVHGVRARLVQAALELIMLLTPVGDAGAKSSEEDTVRNGEGQQGEGADG